MNRERKQSLLSESVLGWWSSLREIDRAAYMAEFRRARAKDCVLQCLYPDDKAPPIVWLAERRAGIKLSAVA